MPFSSTCRSARLLALLILGLPHEKSHLNQFRKADWFGILGLALGLGGLTVLLEEGQSEQWFSST
jgi:DHA2 family multidrug resistance protein